MLEVITRFPSSVLMSPLLSDPFSVYIVPSTFSKSCDVVNVGFSRLAIRPRFLDLPDFDRLLVEPVCLMPEFGVINLLIGKSKGISELIVESEVINWLIGKSVVISGLIGEYEAIRTPLILKKRELKIHWGQRLKDISVLSCALCCSFVD